MFFLSLSLIDREIYNSLCNNIDKKKWVEADMIDLILKNGYVITMDKNRRLIENGAVAVDKGCILDVGTTEERSEERRVGKEC